MLTSPVAVTAKSPSTVVLPFFSTSKALLRLAPLVPLPMTKTGSVAAQAI